jgi:hypothetical protein
MILYHVTVKENLEWIFQKGLIPQTGERSQVLNDWGIFLFKDLVDLEDAVSTWLGDLFEDDKELVILEVDIDKKYITTSSVDYEVICKITIPPHKITLFDNPTFKL